MSFEIDMSCFKLGLLERGVQVTTYDFGLMDNSITNEFDCSLEGSVWNSCCLETVYSGPFTLGKCYKNRSQHLHAIFLKSSVYI
jgi:hypothetical protein